jgi:hypothetical protein
MALQFFRRRQKLVVFIMVMLMISFLIGGYGLSQAFQRGRGSATLGTSKFGKVMMADLVRANEDLTVLRVLNRSVVDQDFATLMANEGNIALAYVLLGQEAAQSSAIVTDEDIDSFFIQRGMGKARLQGLLTALKPRIPTLSIQRLRDIVARWLRVEKFFARRIFFVASPVCRSAAVSEQELRYLYRDLMERIDLRVAAIKAEDFLDEAAEPNDAEIQTQFQTYRADPPGRYGEENPFGFGYAQPHRASVRYLLIRQDVLERVARPTDEELRAHYISHRASYVRKVPLASQPTSEAASQPTSEAASKPVSYRDEPMTFSQAKAEIVKELSDQAVRKAVESLVSQAKTWVDRYAAEAHDSAADVYEYVLTRMTAPADTVLAREITDLHIQAQPLEPAVKALAEKAGLEAIAFPWGKQGDRTLDPNVKVTVEADSITLGEALDKLCVQLKWPKLKWAMTPGLKGALFSVAGDDGVDFFPIQVRHTAPLDMQEMLRDEVLGHSYTSADEPLSRIVFTAQPFRQAAQGGGMKVGEDGPGMIVTDPRPGRLLWRLAAAEPAHAPLLVDDVPGLKDRVKRDIRIRAAFERAVEKARQLREQASKVGLSAAAKKAGLETFQTGPFPRRVEISPLRQYQTVAAMTGGRVAPEMLALQEPFAYPLAGVEGLELPSAEVMLTFMDAAFALVPSNVEPPYPTSPPATGVVPLPFIRQVLVIERAGYEPPVVGEYVKAKEILAAQLEMSSLWRSRITWFSLPAITQRLEFRSSRGSLPVEE